MQPEQLPNPPKRTKKALGIWLLVGPTALIALAVITTILASQMAAPAQDDQLLSDPSAFTRILNISTFVFGGIGFIAWLPGIIIGTILLARKK